MILGVEIEIALRYFLAIRLEKMRGSRPKFSELFESIYGINIFFNETTNIFITLQMHVII